MVKLHSLQLYIEINKILFLFSGPFSDNSKEWKKIPEHIIKQMRVKFQEDGEFYMLLSDFLRHFDIIELCHMSPDPADGAVTKFKWNLSTYEGQWRSGHSQNILIKLVDPDEDDDLDYCTIVVGLMQKNRRSMGVGQAPIKFNIFKVNSGNSKKMLAGNECFENLQPAGSTKFEAYREVCARFKLPPGYYVVIPQTQAMAEGEFLLRIFSEAKPGAIVQQSVIVRANIHAPETAPALETRFQVLQIEDPETNQSVTAASRPLPKVCITFKGFCYFLLVMIISFAIMLAILLANKIIHFY